MMRQYELVERVLRYDPSADEALINRAYVYAMRQHGTQKRASGELYFSHPLEVAGILTEMKLDDATIATALLHDVIEDTEATRAEIDQLFGAEIGALVDGLTKIKRLDLISRRAEQAENFRKLLIAISSDIRVLLVKLADRLHNMRTLEHKKPESRQRNSEETLEIYAPLAGRMGMQAVREELEDLAFRWLHPEAYRTVTDRLSTLRKRNQGLVDEISSGLATKLAEVGVKAEVSGREKKPYSIWRKMENRQISLEQLSDIYGFRLTVGPVEDCYRVLGIVHTTWRAVPGRFKDYISTPKQNGYQSIHTTVVGPRHQRVELQVRTAKMHRIAEHGVAAHALYKDNVSEPVPASAGAIAETGPRPITKAHESSPYIWLRHLVDTLLQGDNPEEFLEHTKLELFQDQVFCFTPKGRLIALPRGATPIDFAYGVHTDVGNHCVGAHVNGRPMPLTTQLRNGDEVLIITSPGQIPPAAWERVAVTGKARSSIRRAARDALRRQYGELGRRLLVSALAKAGEDYTDERVRKALPRLGLKTVDDVLAAIGRSELALVDALRAVAPEALANAGKNTQQKMPLDRGATEDGWFNLGKVIGLKFRWPGKDSGARDEPAKEPADATHAATGNGAANGAVRNEPAVPIRGVRNDVPVSFEEGGAVPGDRIVGVLVPGAGIRVFQIHSPRLKDHEHERWIDVTWDIDEASRDRFPARIMVTALNEPGTLAQIAQVIADEDGNIDNLRMIHRGSDFTEMMIEVEVWNLVHLNRIINRLKARPVVSQAERSFD